MILIALSWIAEILLIKSSRWPHIWQVYIKWELKSEMYIYICIFYLSGFSFMDMDNSQDSRGREGTFFHSTLPLPPSYKHSNIYVQLCTWDDYHIFLIATLVFTRLLIHEIYHLIEWLFDWLMMWCWFKFVCLLIWVKVLLQLFDMWETGGLELASTISLVLQANRLTKCASHPKMEESP